MFDFFERDARLFFHFAYFLTSLPHPELLASKCIGIYLYDVHLNTNNCPFGFSLRWERENSVGVKIMRETLENKDAVTCYVRIDENHASRKSNA